MLALGLAIFLGVAALLAISYVSVYIIPILFVVGLYWAAWAFGQWQGVIALTVFLWMLGLVQQDKDKPQYK